MDNNQELDGERIPIAEILSAYLPKEKAPEPTPQPPQEPEPTEKPKGPPENGLSKKRYFLWATVLVTAMAIAVGVVLWRSPQEAPAPAPTTSAPSTPDPAPSGGFYLLTRAAEYNADGTPGYTQRIYTYDDRGAPLAILTDHGISGEQVWNEDDGVYEIITGSFDGNPDALVQYVYNENGHILYCVETRNKYDADGNLISSDIDTYDRDKSCHYVYDLDGRITEAVLHKVQVGGGTGKDMVTMYYHYDEDGRPVELYLDDEIPYWAFEFRYDRAGRVTAAATRRNEGLSAFFYEYDKNGHLVRATLQTNTFYAALDDNYITTPAWEGVMAPTHQLETAMLLEYDGEELIRRTVLDADARVISRTDLEYADGQLSKVTYTDENESKKVYRYATEGNSTSITLVRDENGNIIRQIFPDGSYIQYEYQRFDLTDEAVQQAKNLQYVLNGIDIAGEKCVWNAEFSGGMAFMADIPYPTTALYSIDILRNQ
ncbi:MAG: hypothetical protein E7466_06095 [Ruminococcaceae bacterium]|nr:hypothetical protein [Oscillospiraceae bacterium]